MRITILGSGTSHGVPMIGCKCAICTSTNPKNRRYRPSITVEVNGKVILVDTSTELRMQSLQFGVDQVDAVMITHTHADHIFGMDDLRRFNDLSGDVIPVYANEDHQADIRRIYPYIFDPPKQGGGVPRISMQPLEEVTMVCDFPVQTVPVMHGSLPVNGFRFGKFAYVTDTNYIPPSSMELLQGLDTLILDAVRFRPHSTHFGLDEAVAIVEILKPKQAFFTHLSHDFDHDVVNATLPSYAQLSYDGQIIEISN
ncbi:MAG: MBL fold metallo-hydrolase [Chthonomonadales bacterium]